MPEFFFDTYALVEYVNANKKFSGFFQQHSGITTRLNLMELYYAMIMDIGLEKAEIAFESFLPLAVEIEDNLVKKAMRLRLEAMREKKNFSYVDAIGYQIALEKGIKFLTGDSQFKGMKNTEFVK